MSENEIDTQRMLLELDFPAGIPERHTILVAYGDALEPIRRMLTGIHSRADAHPQQKFTIYHLLARSLSDLLAGGHLAAHCYLPQAYGVLRPALDSADLVELFARDPEAATKWTTTESAHRDFAPSTVRKLLGRERFDPVHGYFSEHGSHPRFAGAQISGGMRIGADNPDDKTALLRIGPMWPEHPSSLLVWGFAFNLALHVATRGQHLAPLTADEQGARLIWLREYVVCVDAVQTGISIVLDQLGEGADSPLRSNYNSAREAASALLADLSP